MEAVEIECSVCDEFKDVEVGTWALDRGVCEQCYALYQDGKVDI